MKVYCVYQGNQMIDRNLTLPKAQLVCIRYNLMHKENRYREVIQTPRMERMWEGHYD
jgi:hypothetical protein